MLTNTKKPALRLALSHLKSLMHFEEHTGTSAKLALAIARG